MSKKNRVVGILGLGLFGSALAKNLSHNGIDIIACDRDEKIVNALENDLTIASIGDFTDIDFMRESGFGNCDVIVIATGSDLESCVLGVINARELGIETIICKAKNQSAAKVLEALKVSRVVLPEIESGEHIADVLSRNSLEDMIKLDDQTAIVEFRVPQKWLGHTVDALDLRRHYDINIIGLRKQIKETLNTKFDPDYHFGPDDLVVAVVNRDRFQQIDYLEKL
ncbi:TrkA family potassium uptake protein [Aerococcus sp. HMSC06H08]|uniref:potassium channel family protein n=1 Tax=Aerococcus sp. HMSC06H08 TaxID=1581129 RepID=UPI0008A484A1|nr:TrkA family potassium uptake protein [Aerococcus sp. HMSC06H08]OFT39696.1 potassium transporter Trk [Aerococcus sp. HMSC06H08]